jgi:hypothetical protein
MGKPPTLDGGKFKEIVMGEKQAKPLTIDGVEYDMNEFSQEQNILTNHCLDLDRKIASTQFQLQQLEVGKDAFLKMLKASLDARVIEEPKLEA